MAAVHPPPTPHSPLPFRNSSSFFAPRERDLAAVERSELAVDADDLRGIDGGGAQCVIDGETVLDRFADAGEIIGSFARTADEREEYAALGQHRGRGRLELPVADDAQRLLL